MNEGYLNLRDSIAVADFIESVADYLPEKDRKPYQALAADLEAGKKVSTTRMADVARNLGAATWAPRRAISSFLAKKGAEAEWEAVLSNVRPTTALLLKRLRKSSDAKTLDDALNSSDAPMAIHDEEEIELESVRPEIRLKLWQEHQKKLTKSLAECQSELEEIKKRFKRMRDVASKIAAPGQLLSKLEGFEDRVYFGGEVIPLDVLDAELNFEVENMEIPATDDALNGAETLPVRFEVEVQDKELPGERDTEEQKEEEELEHFHKPEDKDEKE